MLRLNYFQSLYCLWLEYLIYSQLCFPLQGLPQALLCRVHFLKEVLLLPALSKGDEKVIGGLACLLSEIGQAVRTDYSFHFKIDNDFPFWIVSKYAKLPLLEVLLIQFIILFLHFFPESYEIPITRRCHATSNTKQMTFQEAGSCLYFYIFINNCKNIF